MKDPIEDSLDLAPMSEDDENLPAVYVEPEEDATLVATNAFKDLIDKSEDALEEMLVIAKQSQDHRAFGSLSKLIKTVAELHVGLLDIQKPKGTSAAPTEATTAQTVHNSTNIFVGTTAELAKLIENARNESAE